MANLVVLGGTRARAGRLGRVNSGPRRQQLSKPAPSPPTRHAKRQSAPPATLLTHSLLLLYFASSWLADMPIESPDMVE